MVGDALPGKTQPFVNEVQTHVEDVTRMISIYSDVPEAADVSQEDIQRMTDFLDCALRNWETLRPKNISLQISLEERVDDGSQGVEAYEPAPFSQESLEFVRDDGMNIDDMFEEKADGEAITQDSDDAPLQTATTAGAQKTKSKARAKEGKAKPAAAGKAKAKPAATSKGKAKPAAKPASSSSKRRKAK